MGRPRGGGKRSLGLAPGQVPGSCEEAQGYAFSRPLPAEARADFLAKTPVRASKPMKLDAHATPGANRVRQKAGIPEEYFVPPRPIVTKSLRSHSEP